MSRGLPAQLYLANLALLFTHEIDSAYWQEWELFGLPGGIQLFLVLNLGLLVAALIGYRQVLLARRAARTFSLVLAGAGIVAFGIHTAFLVAGRPEFRLPVSVALLVLILAVSLAQGVVAFRDVRWSAAPRISER